LILSQYKTFLNDLNKNIENAVSNTKESEKSNYDIHKLRQKIQEQATRLQKLEQYKFLCENRILQLDPAHPLPINEGHLKKHSKDNKGFNNKNNKCETNNDINSHYPNDLNNKDYERKEILLQDEIYGLNEKLHMLAQELASSQNENIYLKKQIHNLNSAGINLNNKAKAALPLPTDTIQSEALRENYHKLFLLYNEQVAEKNQILETLKIETINNEEKKNYIEILKHTIDSFILKNGFANSLNQIKKSFYGKSTNITQAPCNVDFLTEITQLRLDVEKSKKELVLSKALISELKTEVDFITKNNSNMVSTKEKLVENLENGIKELDEARNKLKPSESEKAFFKKEIEILRKTIENLQEELKLRSDFAQKLQNEKEELDNKLIQVNAYMENSQTMQNKIFDYKKSFDKIYIDLNEALNFKKLLEAELLKIKCELENKIIENTEIKEEYKNFDLERKNLLIEKDNCYKQIGLLEKINREMENGQKAKEVELLGLKDKLEKSLNSEKEDENKYEKLMQEYENFKINSKKTIENLHKKLDENINELLNSNSNKKAAYETVKEELLNSNNKAAIDHSKEKELRLIEDENIFLKNKIHLLERELASKNELMQRINERYDTLFVDYNQLENLREQLQKEKENFAQENIYWKKKYDSDLMKKINEIQSLNRDLSNYQTELNENQESINKIKK